MTTMLRWCGFAVVALALLAPARASAQDQPRPPVQREEMERRVRARFAETVKAELGITQEQLERLGQVQQSFQQRRQALFRRDMALRRRRAAGSAAGPTDDQAKEMLEEMASVRAEEAELFRAEMDQMLEVLTPAQLLRFYELREQLMERVRRLRANGPGGPGRGGGPGRPGGPPEGRGPGGL